MREEDGFLGLSIQLARLGAQATPTNITELRIPALEDNQLFRHVLPSAEHGVVVGEYKSLTMKLIELYYWSPEGQPHDDSMPPRHPNDSPDYATWTYK